jgi:hypothetical protein
MAIIECDYTLGLDGCKEENIPLRSSLLACRWFVAVTVQKTAILTSEARGAITAALKDLGAYRGYITEQAAHKAYNNEMKGSFPDWKFVDRAWLGHSVGYVRHLGSMISPKFKVESMKHMLR